LEQVTERTGFLFDGSLDEIDPAIARITATEEARQVDKLIMIASESAAPPAVRQALATVFTDLYAEGYPAARATREPEELLADASYQLAYHERYSDRRYYKGTEYADVVELLAQERIRRLFAPSRFPQNASPLGPEQIQANVQPLSGANANTAVYLGLLQPGDTIMGLNLSHGGHLSHGSPVNVSGKLFKVVDYGVDPATGRIDYDAVERTAREHNPRMIVSGASAYPWSIDFARLRQICDSLPRKAYLLADVSHPAGLVVAGLFPNPVGVADVTTFTTHKTMIGPRAAVILTTNESLARRIDRAVFPGLQGGPHVNTIAALAVAFELALRPAFAELQRAIVKNARALADYLAERGLRIAYGGTETHLFLIDLKSIKTRSGVPLNGEVAARILDLAGIVCNKNTIAGDVSANFPSGLRFGTPWITQRGLTPDDMRVLGGIIADVLYGIETFSYFDGDEAAARGKVQVDVLRSTQSRLAGLIASRAVGPAGPTESSRLESAPAEVAGWRVLEVYGRRARAFFAEATTGEIWGLEPGQALRTTLAAADGRSIAPIALLRRGVDAIGLDHFALAVPPTDLAEVRWWLSTLSSGLVLFDPADPWAKIDGPVAIGEPREGLTDVEAAALRQAVVAADASPRLSKPYFVGQAALARGQGTSAHPASAPPDSSGLSSAGIQTPDGWEMPRSHGDAAAELAALRGAVGLVDESGLGAFTIEGPDAARFLDLVTTNDVAFLAINAAQLTILLDPGGGVVAGGLLYRLAGERYLLTVSPGRIARVEAWLDQIRSGQRAIDPLVPARTLPGDLKIRRNGADTGAESLTALAMVGPNAPALLRALADGADDRRKIARLRRFTAATARLAGQPCLIARTGHTGQAQGYEIFLAPERARTLSEAAYARGGELGLRAVGWDAWHAAGIVAGLALDARELGGPHAITPIEAGFGAEVRAHKPFFVGRDALLRQPYPPSRLVTRFKIVDATVSTELQPGDPIVDDSSTCVGWVTSVSSIATDPIGLMLVARDRSTVGARFVALSGGVSKTTLEQPIPSAGFGRVNVEVLSRTPK
jgi:glycine hydroxymethyltransferase